MPGDFIYTCILLDSSDSEKVRELHINFRHVGAVFVEMDKCTVIVGQKEFIISGNAVKKFVAVWNDWKSKGFQLSL